jgi:hypothetical protein
MNTVFIPDSPPLPSSFDFICEEDALKYTNDEFYRLLSQFTSNQADKLDRGRNVLLDPVMRTPFGKEYGVVRIGRGVYYICNNEPKRVNSLFLENSFSFAVYLKLQIMFERQLSFINKNEKKHTKLTLVSSGAPEIS